MALVMVGLVVGLVLGLVLGWAGGRSAGLAEGRYRVLASSGAGMTRSPRAEVETDRAQRAPVAVGAGLEALPDDLVRAIRATQTGVK